MNQKDRATGAVEAIFSDTSVPPEITLDILIDLREDIDMKIGCLREDIKHSK